MFRTLRSRLILSHILPLLLVVPLVGVGLIYILETQLALADLSEELTLHGELSADIAQDQPAIWTDASAAQQFVSWYAVRTHSQIMLLDSRGTLLASSSPGDVSMVGEPVSLPNLQYALSSSPKIHITHIQTTEVVQVLVPVVDKNEQIIGVVRLSQRLSEARDRFSRLRNLIIGALAVELVLAALLGLFLALRLGNSLQRVTNAIHGVAQGRQWNALEEEGPEEIRTLLQAFNSLIERLRVMEEARRRLLANLVHELGRPIGAIQSGLQALLSGAEQKPQLRRELLEGMDTQVQRMRPLLDSLTDLHGQVLGTLELDFQEVALSEWLPRAVSPWRQAAHDKGLHWRIEIPKDLPVLAIDADRMAQVLGNLLSNAIKYTPEGTISVEASTQAEQVVITVSDTGIGIAPAEQKRIFEPFYRSRRDIRFPQGMGLGLSIARDLVVAHGGHLDVESTPGEGSRFVVCLPFDTYER
jgi:two-component system sensor histidine kinase BaeS